MSQNVSRIERRTIISPLEIRAVTEGGAKKLRGYAAVFNRKSEILWYFREIIKPGAFKNAINKSDVRALVDHDPSRIIGRSIPGRAGNTLSLREDEVGLYYEVEPADTQAGRDIIVSVERGDVSGSSFAFTVRTDTWRTVDGEQQREIEEVDEIFDVSPVTYPAYPDSTVGIRSLSDLTPANLAILESHFDDLGRLESLARAHREAPHRPRLEKEVDQLRRDAHNRRIIY